MQNVVAIADITTILNVIQNTLLNQFPSVPCLVKAKSATEGGKVPQPGWTPGSALPVFVVSEGDPEIVDSAANFEFITLSYPVVIEYLKSAAPKSWEDDPEIRAVRIAFLELFYRGNLPNIPKNVFDIRPREQRPPYAPAGADSVAATAITIVYTLWLQRPGTF